MKKSILSLAAAALLASCSFNDNEADHYVVVSGADDTSYLKDVEGCPKIHIREDDVKIVQKEDYQELFEIKAVGYEGICYFNEKVEKDRAVVKPKFKVMRLSDSDVTDVQFSYYLETVEGPTSFLGRKTYFASANMPVGVNEMEFTADAGELTIPVPGTYDLDIFLGLIANAYDLEYKKK